MSITSGGSSTNPPSGGGGNTISLTAIGSEPGSPASGNADFYNNGQKVGVYNGSIWVPYGPLYPMTEPNDGSFSWTNQGGAAVATTNGGIVLSAPANTGDSWRIRRKAVPSAPYTVTICFKSMFLAQHMFAGIVLRDSASSKFISVGVGFSSSLDSFQLGIIDGK